MKEKIYEIFKTVARNFREIIGWLIIAAFSYVYLFKINNLNILKGRERAFDFLVIIMIIILAWLWINKRKL